MFFIGFSSFRFLLTLFFLCVLYTYLPVCFKSCFIFPSFSVPVAVSRWGLCSFRSSSYLPVLFLSLLVFSCNFSRVFRVFQIFLLLVLVLVSSQSFQALSYCLFLFYCLSMSSVILFVFLNFSFAGFSRSVFVTLFSIRRKYVKRSLFSHARGFSSQTTDMYYLQLDMTSNFIIRYLFYSLRWYS